MAGHWERREGCTCSGRFNACAAAQQLRLWEAVQTLIAASHRAGEVLLLDMYPDGFQAGLLELTLVLPSSWRAVIPWAIRVVMDHIVPWAVF